MKEKERHEESEKEMCEERGTKRKINTREKKRHMKRIKRNMKK